MAQTLEERRVANALRERIKRAADPELARARARECYARNPEAGRAKSMRWAKANPDKAKETQAKSKRKNREKIAETERAWRSRNPHKKTEYNRRRALKRLNAPNFDFDQVFEAQGDQCAICGTAEKPKSKGWSIDHCHKTGRVRGILCGSCNVGLGHFKDNPKFLIMAIEYLKG